ncbi:MAG: hypothetical protein AVDCRST_MAG19-473 [uncultured Thermomicrobiales bacterium]|uniref:Holin n=1 Tax=uncultured Thermomicrobiales bacterium TaxID=1645740 RepID=A0A6J4UG27_9BACT|nr:MAG: hypothetical protein AVDCRST_MAG19-473 [uncultured Thermomicrobiales bacterium]
MNDATRRALRTLLQVGIGFVLAGGLAEVVNAYADEWAIAGANRMLVTAALTVAVTFAQNYAEDRGAIPAIGKAPASGGANPVPDDAGPS